MRVDPQHDRLAPLVPRASRASRLSCLAPLVPRASRASRLKHVRLSATCASQQRASPACAPLSNVKLVFCHVRLASTSSRKQLQLSSGRVQTHPLFPSHVRFSTRAPLSTSAFFLSQVLCSAFSLNHCAPPSSGRVASMSANREDTQPLPPAFPRFGNRQMMSLRSGGPRGRFGGKPRRGHAASPSVPRGA